MAVVSTVFLFGGAAQAQTYPPGTGVPRCSPGDANAGIVDPGQSIQFILCGNFDPGSTVNITANGISAGTKPPANDAVTVEVEVLSRTAAAVDDPTVFGITCGTTSTITVTGPSASGGICVSHGTFLVLCTSNAAITPGSSGLVFTGAHVVTALVVAMALIVLGALLVISQRRRREGV